MDEYVNITFITWWHGRFSPRGIIVDRGWADGWQSSMSRYVYSIILIVWGQMYTVELEIKDTTESRKSASYLDLLLLIEREGQRHTSIYYKHDDFNFHITYFRFLGSNIPASPAYCVFISKLYNMTGLAPGIDVSCWGRHDFQISFTNRDTSRNA